MAKVLAKYVPSYSFNIPGGTGILTLMSTLGAFSKLKNLAQEGRGPDLVEDALLACYVALSVMATFPDVAVGLNGIFSHLTSAVAKVK